MLDLLNVVGRDMAWGIRSQERERLGREWEWGRESHHVWARAGDSEGSGRWLGKLRSVTQKLRSVTRKACI